MSLIIKGFEWFVNNINVLKANWGTFLIFGVLIVALTYQFTKGYIKKQYDSLPDRAVLQEQVNSLKKENQKLLEQLRELSTTSKLLNGAHGKRVSNSVGDLIDEALHKTESM